jgi:pimeloyl-ACP methyl ester carboxylesterase
MLRTARTVFRWSLVFGLSSLVFGSWGSLVSGFYQRPETEDQRLRGVEHAGFVRIGGIDQWISIRGADRANPVILVVHGGPGEAQWLFAPKFRAWEQAFVVVQWDQRGAGHTYGRNGAGTPEVNLDRITRDGIEVAEHALEALGKKKVIVLGHSWGSTVAVHMAQRRPDLFAAYVGTGQVASWKASVQFQFDVLLAKARRENDKAAIEQFEAIGTPDPTDAKQYFTFTRTLRAAWSEPDRKWIEDLRASVGKPESLGLTAKDIQNLGDGMNFSAKQVLPDMMTIDLPATANQFDVPFFVIQGRDDVTTPTPPAVAYFNSVDAPAKELILIEHAGHFAYLTHASEFLAALTGKVRPVAISRGA